MTSKAQNIPFPAITKISFFRIVESLEVLSKDKDPFISTYAKNLLDETRQYPELIEGFEDNKLLKKYKSTIDKLIRTLFPQSLQTNEIKGVIPPFEFEPFYVSQRFEKILDDAGDFSFELDGFNADMMYIYGCVAILEGYYNYEVNTKMPNHVDIPNKKTGEMKTYRMAFNADLMEIIPTEKSREITPEDYKELVDDFHNIELWKEKFPPRTWLMRGIGIANFMDVTLDRAINNINSNILIKTDDSFHKVHNEMKVLFNSPDLEFGFIPFHNDELHKVPKEGMKSVVLGNKEFLRCDSSMCPLTYKTLIVDKEPLVVSNAEKYNEQSQSQVSESIVKKGVKSFIIAPINDGDELIGFMELTSPRLYKLNAASMTKLETILPTITIAASRYRREAQNLRDVIIQQECTTIHDSVKWRFEEEADKYIAAQYRNEQPIFSDIVFKDVYPLYGQIDIKGSSLKRNDAVKKDLLAQLKLAEKVLLKASKMEPLPIYEDLIFRLESSKKKVNKGLISGTEREVLGFLESEIYPVFEHLRENAELGSTVNKYFNSLAKEIGTVYDKRKNYDESVNKINYALAEVLDQEQIEAQKMFPHYFERFKTDGVEYDMYIGQSMSRSRNFDPIYLKNLRLWQLLTMCKMEREFGRLRPMLDTELDVTSLILVYNTSLAVHFRTDEKRFDVEGAYNARYEIVKKRVDKATVKGKPERITQPGKLAIVYSTENDAREYKKYLQFMESKGLIKKNSLEQLELEDLQGISGLWALRVELNYDNAEERGDTFSVEKILEELEN